MNEQLPMSPDEIVRDYLAAKTPLKQIKILAELNCTDKQTIVKILKDAGAPLPKNYFNGKNLQRKQDEQPEQTAADYLTVGTLQNALAEFPGGTPILVGGMKLTQLIYTMTRGADGSRMDALELR